MTDKPAVEKEATVNVADEVLENAKGNFQSLLVIGFKQDGEFDLASTLNNFPSIQYLLQKAAFEMFVLEKNMTQSKKENA